MFSNISPLVIYAAILFFPDTHGYPASFRAATPYVIGGAEVIPHSIPWQVAIVGSNGGRPDCGGTLISYRHVLSAAHCGDRDVVIVGKHSLKDSSDGVRHKICRTVFHPNFNAKTMEYDFAIHHLEQPVSFGSNVSPACLPSGRFDGVRTGKKMRVSGWGWLEYQSYKLSSWPDKLQGVEVSAITNDRCRNLYNGIFPITSDMMCAQGVENGMQSNDACLGDSGGPLTQEIDGEATVVGVVSFGVQCGKVGLPGVYSRVTSAMSFINKQLLDTCSGSAEKPNICGKKL